MSATTSTSLRARLIDAIGAAAVIDDAAHCAFMSHDVYHSGGLPILVVRPCDVAALQSAVRLCAQAGVAMVPRGGGTSYTDGYLYAPGGHVLFDTGALDDIAINADTSIVTVGAGVTWARLKATLAEHGLRTPFWGPFSGQAATVGGSISQHTLSHGTGAHGPSAASVLSMDVVLASGELLSTSPSLATRHYGPDLTGLFTGDCGALGIKATIRLPLLAVRECFEALTFAFDDFASYHAAARKVQRESLDDSHFGLDLTLSTGQIDRHRGLGAKLQIAREIWRAAPNRLAGARQVLVMVLAGSKAFRAGRFMCHFIVEGVDRAHVAAKSARLRAVIAPFGREDANSVPNFVRTLPFAPLTNILGPGGERWVPLHGVLRHDEVTAFHTALVSFYESRKEEMERLGVWTGTMFSPVGSSGFLYEIAVYWPDTQTAYHTHMLDLGSSAPPLVFPPNLEARSFVDRLKSDIIDLFQRYRAAHFQIGRIYPYRQRLDPQASTLLSGIKSLLDPHNLMNPGALDLGSLHGCPGEG